ncbi:MAG: exo-alpha-sialidase [Alphaproteobacteria bacterium]|nr:exo-alpha-sialidase [Alphaproteobacteria bacterium]
MSVILVGTRKGLFVLEPSAAGWRIARTAFLGDPVTMVLTDARDGRWYAALEHGHFGPKVHASDDRGVTWTEVATPSFPAEEGEDGAKGPSVSSIWSMETASDGGLWCGTIPAALFRSDDQGASWQRLAPFWELPQRAQWFGGGKDDAGLHSICVDPTDPRHLAVAISSGGVWDSPDDGQTWDLRADGMIACYMPPERQLDPNVQDVHRLVQSPTHPDHLWVQHHCGAWRSTDGGRSWQALDVPPSAFGFPVVVHPTDPHTAWFVPAVKDQFRIPVDGKVVVARTRDGGASFEVLADGLPQEHAYDLVYRHALDIDATGDRLAFGSTTGALWTTDDGGDHWHEVSAHLPPIYVVRFGA